MLGNKSGVAVRLQRSSPSMVAFHCPAHRLQLAIIDIAEDVTAFVLAYAYIRMCLFRLSKRYSKISTTSIATQQSEKLASLKMQRIVTWKLWKNYNLN